MHRLSALTPLHLALLAVATALKDGGHHSLAPARQEQHVERSARVLNAPGDFCASRAHEAARLSQLAYATDDAQQVGCADLGFEHLGTVDGCGGTRALLARRDDSLIVSFRGTANLLNFASGCDNRLVPLALCGVRNAPADCAVRAGYGSAFAAIGPRLLEKLQDLAISAQPEDAARLGLVVVGHSFGGSLAALFALAAACDLHSFTSIEGFSFGAGRLGNEAFARHFDEAFGLRRRCSAPEVAAQPADNFPLPFSTPYMYAFSPAPFEVSSSPSSSPSPALSFWSLALPSDPLTHLPPRHLGFADHASPQFLLRRQATPNVAELHAPLASALAILAMNSVCAAQELAALAADPIHSHRISTYCAALADGRVCIASGRDAARQHSTKQRSGAHAERQRLQADSAGLRAVRRRTLASAAANELQKRKSLDQGASSVSDLKL